MPKHVRNLVLTARMRQNAPSWHLAYLHAYMMRSSSQPMQAGGGTAPMGHTRANSDCDESVRLDRATCTHSTVALTCTTLLPATRLPQTRP